LHGAEVRGENFKTVGEFTVREGEKVPFVLTYGSPIAMQTMQHGIPARCRRQHSHRLCFERDPIPYALETDWPVEAAGFETLHFRIGVRQDPQLGAGAFEHAHRD
jgi:hypothetical protein